MYRIITDEETIEATSWDILGHVIDQVISDERLFYNLQWDESIPSCVFVQGIMGEGHPRELRVEIAIDQDGHNHIYYLEGVTKEWTLRMIQTMYETKTMPDMSAWEYEGAFPRQ